jgi:hypothetical protein
MAVSGHTKFGGGGGYDASLAFRTVTARAPLA